MLLTVNVVDLDNAGEIQSAIVDRIRSMPDDEFSKLVRTQSFRNLETMIDTLVKERADAIIRSITGTYGNDSLNTITRDVLMADIVKPAIEKISSENGWVTPAIDNIIDNFLPDMIITSIWEYISNRIEMRDYARRSQITEQIQKSIMDARHV